MDIPSTYENMNVPLEGAGQLHSLLSPCYGNHLTHLQVLEFRHGILVESRNVHNCFKSNYTEQLLPYYIIVQEVGE